MNYSTSPFNGNQNIANNKEAVLKCVSTAKLELPPEEAQHFISHCDEMNPVVIFEAFQAWNKAAGVHEIQVTSECAVTRLHGPKMNGENLQDENRYMICRGLGRPPQPVVLRNKPFQSTNIVTLVIFPDPYGNLTLFTMHAGPSMAPDFEDPEWESNALAYTKEEISLLGVDKNHFSQQ